MVSRAVVAVFVFLFWPALVAVGSYIFWAAAAVDRLLHLLAVGSYILTAVAVCSSFFWLVVSVCSYLFWLVFAMWSYLIGPVVTMEAPEAAGMFISLQAFEACPVVYYSLLRRFGSAVAVRLFGGLVPGFLIHAMCSIPAAARRLLQRSADDGLRSDHLDLDGAAVLELVKAKADELFPPETRSETLGRWLQVAVTEALSAVLGALALSYIIFRCCCCASERGRRGTGSRRIRGDTSATSMLTSPSSTTSSGFLKV